MLSSSYPRQNRSAAPNSLKPRIHRIRPFKRLFGVRRGGPALNGLREEHLGEVRQRELIALAPEHHERDNFARILGPVQHAAAALVELPTAVTATKPPVAVRRTVPPLRDRRRATADALHLGLPSHPDPARSLLPAANAGGPGSLARAVPATIRRHKGTKGLAATAPQAEADKQRGLARIGELEWSSAPNARIAAKEALAARHRRHGR